MYFSPLSWQHCNCFNFVLLELLGLIDWLLVICGSFFAVFAILKCKLPVLAFYLQILLRKLIS
jgi:hypothetical protein